MTTAGALPLPDSCDFERGQLARQSFIRLQRLFTVEHQIILHSVGKVTAAKFDEVFEKARAHVVSLIRVVHARQATPVLTACDSRGCLSTR
jgi:hypothetical protein